MTTAGRHIGTIGEQALTRKLGGTLVDEIMIQDHLDLAEGHVRLGLEHIAKQRVIIAELEGNGLDTSLAREVLATFEGMQKAHVADRDRLRLELEEARRDE